MYWIIYFVSVFTSAILAVVVTSCQLSAEDIYNMYVGVGSLLDCDAQSMLIIINIISLVY